MAQWLRELVTLPEDLGSFPSTHMATHNCLLTPVPGDPMSSLASMGKRQTGDAQTQTWAKQPHTEKKRKEK